MSTRSSVQNVAARLRDLSLDADVGALLGREETLVAELGAAQGTLRQAARLVEREGLLLVRRGKNGGYFAARPDIETLESIASSYLALRNVDTHNLSFIASLLWTETIRQACTLRTEASAEVAARLQRRLTRLRSDAPVSEVVALDEDFRTAMFDLTDARYIELIYNINVAFSRRRIDIEKILVPRPGDPDFVRRWRNAKMMELQAIADGDPDGGVSAAHFSRRVWYSRFLPDSVKVDEPHGAGIAEGRGKAS